MLFGDLRSEIERIRDETSNKFAQVARTELPMSADQLIRLRKEVVAQFERVIQNINCVERDLWETVGKKSNERS